MTPHWALPAACAALSFVAAHAALVISAQAGLVPACIPYVDGCTSISRAARHGVGSFVFKALMIPCAALMVANWIAASTWPREPARPLVPLGLVAGSALAVYVVFLGTEGDVYRFLRRYGVTIYFAATYLAQLVFLRAAFARGTPRAPPLHAMLAISVALLALGVASTAVTGLADDPLTKDRWENRLEWILGLLVTLWFACQAWLYGTGATSNAGSTSAAHASSPPRRSDTESTPAP